MQTKYPKVNYVGSKNKLSCWIVSLIPADCKSIIDGFAGSGVLSYIFRKNGYNTIINDSLYASYVTAKALVENKNTLLTKADIEGMDTYPINNSIIKDTDFLRERFYYGYEVDEINHILSFANDKLTGYKWYMLIALLRRAMIRKMPYSRMNLSWESIQQLRDEQWSYKKYGRKRAYHNKTFTYHILDNIENYNNAISDYDNNVLVYQADLLSLLTKNDKMADMIYLDPPYPGTMNDYDKFYDPFDQIFHKKIEHEIFNKSKEFLVSLENIVDCAYRKGYKYLMISFNNHSKPGLKEIRELFNNYGKTTLYTKDHNYQVSGKENKNSNKEMVLLLEFTQDNKDY